MLVLKKSDEKRIKGFKANRKAVAPNPTRADAITYAKSLISLNKNLKDISKSPNDLIVAGATPQEVRDFLNTNHDKMTSKYNKAALLLATAFISKLNKRNKSKNENIFAKALNVEIGDLKILDTAQIVDARELAILENVQLIKSIPQEYFTKVVDAISRNFKGIAQDDAKTLAGRLQNIGNITQRRAVFIARDQTAKVNSALTQARHQAAGVNKYSWSTSKDNRVVGTPGGKWPKATRAHGNHYKRQGDIFYYNDPPPDGHPGEAPGCRCKPVAIIDPQDLLIV